MVTSRPFRRQVLWVISWIKISPVRLPLPNQYSPCTCALKSRCIPHNVSPEADYIIYVPSKQVAVGSPPYQCPGQWWTLFIIAL